MDTVRVDYKQPIRGEPTMAGQWYSAQSKGQALALVGRRDKPASVTAQELGIARKTL